MLWNTIWNQWTLKGYGTVKAATNMSTSRSLLPWATNIRMQVSWVTFFLRFETQNVTLEDNELLQTISTQDYRPLQSVFSHVCRSKSTGPDYCSAVEDLCRGTHSCSVPCFQRSADPHSPFPLEKKKSTIISVPKKPYPRLTTTNRSLWLLLWWNVLISTLCLYWKQR